MNPKFFIADFLFLIAFILQGMETHDSGSSFVEISLPYISAIIVIMTILYSIGFIQIDENPAHVKSLRVWMAIILFGTMIRFIINDNFAIMYLIVITGYSVFTSGTIRLIHSKLQNTLAYVEGASSRNMEGNNSRAIPFFSGSN